MGLLGSGSWVAVGAGEVALLLSVLLAAWSVPGLLLAAWLLWVWVLLPVSGSWLDLLTWVLAWLSLLRRGWLSGSGSAWALAGLRLLCSVG